jgi:hypothetical protein
MFRSRRTEDQDPTIVTMEGCVSGSGPAAALRMTNYDTGEGAPIPLAEIAALDASRAGCGTLALRTYEDGIVRTAVTITHDLRVGVGTSDPAAELDVKGTVRADSFSACALALEGDARVANLLVAGDLAVTGMITVGGRESAGEDDVVENSADRSFRSIAADSASIGDLAVTEMARIGGELDVAESARVRSLDVAEKALVAELDVSRKAFVAELEVLGPALASQLYVAGTVSASDLAISRSAGVAEMRVAGKAIARDLEVTGTATLASLVAMDALAISALGVDAAARAQVGKGATVCGAFYWRRGDRAPTMITAIVVCSDARGAPIVRAFEPGRNALLGTKDAGAIGADVPSRVAVALTGTLSVPRSEDVYSIEIQIECIGKGTARLVSYVVRT